MTALFLAGLLLQTAVAAPQAPAAYVPPRGAWETRTPAESGFDAERLAAAVAFTRECEGDTPKDLAEFIRRSFGHEPHSDIVGPTRERAAQNGILIKDGYIVAEWGDTLRPDMTFSVTKTYLSTVVGLAVARGYIDDVHDPLASRGRHGSTTTSA